MRPLSEDILAFVCPVYNEADNIGRQLNELAAKVKVPAELIIVYDFDEDNTLPVVREQISSFPFPIRLIRNAYGRGAMNAVKTGLQTCTNRTAVCVIMADLSDDISVVNRMYELIQDGTYDVVNGSRYMRGGKQIGGPPFKAFLSRTAGLSLHYLAGMPTHDATNNFKMYRGSFLSAIEIESKGGFEIGLELVGKAYVGGYSIGEVPSVWTDRVAGESRFDLIKWLPQYLKWYWYAFRGWRKPKLTDKRLRSGS
jgi:glycosyltransferase involved in cell wall biosynthesis